MSTDWQDAFALALRCFAMVVMQQSAESFATDDIAIGPTDSVVRFEEIVSRLELGKRGLRDRSGTGFK